MSMSALLRRLRPARPAPEATAEDETRTLPETPPAEPEAPGPPAGIAPEDLIGERPDTRRRGRLRRRLRHLRQIRELMLRDLGGIAYEIHRAPAGDDGARAQGLRVLEGKLERLVGLDAERRELEVELGDVRAETVLRESGVGGACPACGEYFASDAHFCANCGTRVDGTAASAPTEPAETVAEAAPEPARPASGEPAPEPTPVDEPVTEVRS